ncbi:ATP-grasp domain-containing protein [Candidatus Daviesbacteria bacterium]|nr:ATP-grasp domain-containing protein [Candidatus Daviesbacteria bacterium]
MKVLIITGGTSSERPVSLKSARQVKKGLEESNHQATLFDLKKGKEKLKETAKKFDVIFPVLHGEEGEGGTLQKLLADIGKPFVGGDPKGFKEGWYKISFKKFCNKNKILTAPWKKVKSKIDMIKFGFPSVLKASNGGSSKEVIILKTEGDLKKADCQKLLKSNTDLFVERFLPGIEVTAAILDNKALPLIEIVPPKGGWFDYKNKYSGATKEITNAPSVNKSLTKSVQKMALKIHQLLNLGSYSRIDFIIFEGKPYVLEINTIPGLTSESLFPKAAKAVGISFPKLMDKLVKMAYEEKLSKTK